MKLALLGGRNVGKTRLQKLISGEPSVGVEPATIGADVRSVIVDGCTVRLWEVGGCPQYRKLGRECGATADAVVVCFSTLSARSVTEAEQWLEELAQLRRTRKTSTVALVGVCPVQRVQQADDASVVRLANILAEVAGINVYYVRSREDALEAVRGLLSAAHCTSLPKRDRDLADTCCHML